VALASSRLSRRLPPPALLALTLLLTIAIGATLLRLPFSQTSSTLSWLDAFFTAVSATCVTGLLVVDTGTHLTFFGQCIVLLLIQIGGLGVMTIGTEVFAALGQRSTPIMRHLVTGLANHRPTLRARDIVATVMWTTAVVELVGAGVLFFAFVQSHTTTHALWLAVLHLRDLNVRHIVAKAVSEDHRRLLQHLNVNTVIFPEADMAQRTARTLANPQLLDTLQLGDRISRVEIAPSQELIGHTLAELHLRQQHHVTVVAIRDTLRDQSRVNPDPHAAITDSDALIVLGKDDDVNRFSRRK
jgi:hypothetical protein